MKKVFEDFTEGAENAKRTEKEVDQTRIILEGGKEIWITYELEQDKRAEIISDDPAIKKCLSKLAEENPEAVSVLTEEEDEQIQAIVGPEVTIEFRPATGSIVVWVESPEEYKPAQGTVVAATKEPEKE